MMQIDQLLDYAPGTEMSKEARRERVVWLVRVLRWLRQPASWSEARQPWERTLAIRLQYLLQKLEKNERWRQQFIAVTSLTLREMTGVALFAQAGLTAHTQFFADLWGRIQERLLPQAPLDENLPSFLREVFPDNDDAILVDHIDEPILIEFILLFRHEHELALHLNQELRQSTQILAMMVAHSAMSFAAANEDRFVSFDHWPEMRLLEVSRRLVLVDRNESIHEAMQWLNLCRQRIDEAQKQFLVQGISVDQVFNLNQRRRWLDRLELIFDLILRPDTRKLRAKSFLAQLIQDVHQNKNLWFFLRENLSLLSQRIVARNSEIGEHYVTYSWRDFREMLISSCGGGAVTSVTVFVKLLLTKMQAAGFIQGFLEGANYAGSFLVIQFSGFTLATKQPSTTAPYLAEKMREGTAEAEKAIIALLRTQWVGVLGNILFVIPLCLIVSGVTQVFDVPVISGDKALALLKSTDLLGPSLIFAAFTGVLLFLSSLFAGAFENWVVLHRLPERLECHIALGRHVNMERRKRWAHLLRFKANAIAANVSLGFLLGLAPQVVKFFGFPLEVRHITLAMGAWAMALPAYLTHHPMLVGQGWLVIRAIVGIFLIGVVNIGVSFSLAFFLAASSRGVRFQTLVDLLGWGMRLMVTKPWLLFVPEPKDSESSSHSS